MFSIADPHAPVNRKQKDSQTFFQNFRHIVNLHKQQKKVNFAYYKPSKNHRPGSFRCTSSCAPFQDFRGKSENGLLSEDLPPQLPQQRAKEIPVVHLLDEQHFLCAVIRRLARRVGQHAAGGGRRLEEQPIVVDPADKAAAHVQQIFAHHGSVRHVSRARGLFEDKRQIAFS